MADLGWSVDRIGALTGGRVVGDRAEAIDEVVIDSRQDVRGALFVALAGERFDGHDFVAQAVDGGAAAVLVARDFDGIDAPQVVVDDTLVALQALGMARRRRFDGPVVAITGSSGKTTTRGLLASIVGVRYDTHQPVKNFNNHFGVPLTLLGLEQRHEAVVLELGCSGFGEIELLTRLSEPSIGLVTNVGPAHLEQLGDLDGVARAKGELFSGLSEKAIAVVNLDDPRVAAMPRRPVKRLTFGHGADTDVRLVDRRTDGIVGQSLVLEIAGRRIAARLGLLGIHNSANALAAAAAAVALGLTGAEIVEGLAAAQPVAGRLDPRVGPRDALVIDDTYNANPASTGAALEVLTEVASSGRRIAVLGDMLELGNASQRAHLEIGARAARRELALLVTVGEMGQSIGRGALEAGLPPELHRHAADHDHAAQIVRERLDKGMAVLVKGSRGMRMEKVVIALTEGAD
ncbi:MAG: UDP-N-acetylmuramoyl-tripeptide--D-alanyl-D-alanine ligase [Deltaproteobacteria bacterium]|nr:UDP-N-acetylmuramoyl-tripeptide--D-alanyl-D-alanine ligase [Deltaproteobacteria bacterium]